MHILKKVFSIQANVEHYSDRYSTSYGTRSEAFTLFNMRASAHVYKWFSIEAGVNNILDTNYSLVEGYPEAGRNFFINLLYRL